MWAYIVRNIAQRLVLLFFVSILAHSVIHLGVEGSGLAMEHFCADNGITHD